MTYGVRRISPHFCHGDMPFRAGPAGAGCTSGSAIVATCGVLSVPSGGPGRHEARAGPEVPPPCGAGLDQPATCLMRATISSVAFSGVQPSLTTRLIALAHTFSLLRTVNL